MKPIAFYILNATQGVVYGPTIWSAYAGAGDHIGDKARATATKTMELAQKQYPTIDYRLIEVFAPDMVAQSAPSSKVVSRRNQGKR